MALAGCAGDPSGSSSSGSSSEGGPDSALVSNKANVRFKGAERLRNAVAQALSLDPGEVCNELGKYSCADAVHTVALGGVDPYGAGLYEPFPDTAASTPLVVERLVLSACVLRAKRDF